MSYNLLIINPGSTSTKIGVYNDKEAVFVHTLRHSTEEIGKYPTIYSQFEFRKKVILDTLKENNIDVKSFDAIIGRGGLLKPIEGGTYAVNDIMLEDLKVGISGQHASNLGGIIAHEIAKEIGVPSYIVDPVVVDELQDVARISGLPEIPRVSIFHALNQKAVAKRYAHENNKRYEDLNLIVAHMGGGISVSAHQKGRVIDTNNALEGDGPFSPERTGGLPVGELIKLCYSGKFTYEEIRKMINGKGGLTAYLGTNDAKKVGEMAQAGDKKAELIQHAMCYQVSKAVGECAVVLKGKVDAILLTGGIAYGKDVDNYIKEHVEFIAPVVVYPGEDELLALAEGGIRALSGEEKAKEYK